jgi:hypothetical protein
MYLTFRTEMCITQAIYIRRFANSERAARTRAWEYWMADPLEQPTADANFLSQKALCSYGPFLNSYQSLRPWPCETNTSSRNEFPRDKISRSTLAASLPRSTSISRIDEDDYSGRISTREENRVWRVCEFTFRFNGSQIMLTLSSL